MKAKKIHQNIFLVLFLLASFTTVSLICKSLLDNIKKVILSFFPPET